MKLRNIYWILIILLVGVIVLEILDIRSLHGKVILVKSKMPREIADDFVSLKNTVTEHKGYIDKLEEHALWPSGQDMVSWLAKQAADSGVQIVGLQYLPADNISQYKQVPVTVTLRGTYNPLGRFINRMERSPNALKIDSLNALCKDRTPDQITMDLSLTYFQKVNEL
jgi:Tfp pilus assembly protein PilO